MPSMTLTELRYIVALAQEQHFGRAAERCHVSQPTLSIAVKKLEEELGVLFERGKQKILPTPLGEKIVAMASRVLEQAAAIKDVADADKDQLEGPIALGTLPTIGPYLLPQFIPLLQETSNKLSLYVEEGSVSELATKLRSGDLDAVLVTAPFVEADVVTQPLFDEPFVVLLPADHRLATRSDHARPACPRELLLLGEGDSLREQILAAFPHLDPHLEPARACAPSRKARRSKPCVTWWPRGWAHHPSADRGGSPALCPESAGHPALRQAGAQTQPGAGLAREFSAT